MAPNVSLRSDMERLIPCRQSFESGEVRPVNATVPVTVSRYHFRRVWAHLLKVGVKPKSNAFGFTLVKATEITNGVGQMGNMNGITKEAFLHILLEIQNWDFPYDEIAVRTSSVSGLEHNLSTSH